MNKRGLIIIAFIGFWSSFHFLQAQENGRQHKEDEYYHILTLPIRNDISMEVGGLCNFPDGRLAACTRKGDIWLIENPDMKDGVPPRYTLFAEGLHEPLGMTYHEGAILLAQRGELTKITDTDGDDQADMFETIYDWPLSGNYHEYSFGPKFLPDGSMMVTLNVAFGGGKSYVPWRGWALRIFPDGSMEPWACGLRSPCGTGVVNGDFFYTDNQGGWVGSGGLWHVKKGGFMGQPESLNWTHLEGSPITFTREEFDAQIKKMETPVDGGEQKENVLLYKFQEEVPELQTPAVWLPHGILGISNSEILVDDQQGKFGPFEGQLFIGDQGQSKIMRVDLEKVNGEYQGVAFDFRQGFQCGVLRLIWSQDGGMYVGQTNRGWGSAGNTPSGIQRVVWSGKLPFEMKTVKAKADGFEIVFTKPVDRESAEDLDSYSGRSFIYKYHKVYGSPIIDQEKLTIKGVKVSKDGLRVRVVIDNLRQHYLHELHVDGIKAATDLDAVLHPVAYYTLKNIPNGDKLSLSELSTKSSSKLAAAKLANEQQAVAKARQKAKAEARAKALANAIPTYQEVHPLLTKNTCTACHKKNQRVVGPAFSDVAKRNYSNERIVELIYKPEPDNWPDFATPMAPMPQVPRNEAMKIAKWINSLN